MANHKPLERMAIRAMVLELHKLRHQNPTPDEFTNSLATLVLDMVSLAKGEQKVFASMADAVVQVMIRLKSLETGETVETESLSGVRV